MNDAVIIQTDMLTHGYTREFCSDAFQAILRVIGDIEMICNEDDLHMLMECIQLNR